MLVFLYRPELLTEQVKQEMPSIPVCESGTDTFVQTCVFRFQTRPVIYSKVLERGHECENSYLIWVSSSFLVQFVHIEIVTSLLIVCPVLTQNVAKC